jgi:hypothetical protein
MHAGQPIGSFSGSMPTQRTDWFGRLAADTAIITGKPATFLLALLVVSGMRNYRTNFPLQRGRPFVEGKTITSQHTDPIYLAIEKHPMADAAYDDALDRSADESVKEKHRQKCDDCCAGIDN